MIGRSDLLEMNEAIEQYKAKGLDFSKVLYSAETREGNSKRCVDSQTIDLSLSLDKELIERSSEAIEKKEPVKIEMPIRNFNRSVGATLSYMVAKKYGSIGLPDSTIKVKFTGSAGQSFAAFLAPGITFELIGDANDYLGKGLSGGKIIIKPPAESTFIPQSNIITGNVNLFGATSGEVYIHGMAGERFGVRNSGAIAVVEGVGDHCCEYMTGGRIIVLGRTGVNFAAGMSGGIAFVLDENQLFDTRCNLEMVDIEPVSDPIDLKYLLTYIRNHLNFSGSFI
ncbi:MAG: hypothetical protein L7F78_12320 [Syntrophales bacterium LBB04]|nr:hypothetical protein [Syntrophales bacterium LBB04]